MSAATLSIWPPLPLTALARRPAAPPPFPLMESGCRLYMRARHGLCDGASALGLRPGDEVLAPAYHHGSEIEALRRAGLMCRFYDATDSLEPDDAELDGLLSPRSRALHLTHVLGFPMDAPRWRQWCDERGLLLIEDAAQAWLAELDGRPVGSFGQLAIFCLYKTVGLPLGSAVVASPPPCGPPARRSVGGLRLARFAAGRLLRRSHRLGRLLSRRQGPYRPEEDFDLGDVSVPLPTTWRLLVPRLATGDVPQHRRANYARLLDDLVDLVPSPFSRLHPGASPFIFPIAVEDKDIVLRRLAGEIDVVNFWSVPHPSLATDQYPGAAKRRATTLGLPVHQGLRPDHLERVIQVVRGAAQGGISSLPRPS